MLDNSRHERFAQELAKGKPADEAYSLAGYRSNRRNASRLKSNEDIRARVAEIQRPAAKRASATVETLADELEAARLQAMSSKNASAAVSAVMGKAKLFGLIVDRHRHSGAVAVVSITQDQLSELTDHELDLLEEVYPVLEKLGLVGPTDPANDNRGDAA